MDPLPLFGAKRPGTEYRLRPGAYVLVLDAESRVAVVHEDGEWTLPGGGLEAGETPEQALAREVREECACGVDIGPALGQALEFLETRSGRCLEVHAHFFRGRFVGTPTVSWHPPEEACGLVVRRSDAWAIRRAATGLPTPVRRFVDLSHTVHDGLITYPGLPAPKISEHLSRATSRAHYAPGTEFSIGKLELVANTGTYLDAPFHRYEGGRDLSELELATLADLDGLVVRAPRGQRALGPELFRGRELTGRAVLVDTGWSQHFGGPQYGSGHPFLTREAGELLVAARPLLVGIDSLNIDDTSGGERPLHSLLLGRDIHVVEHLTGLDQLPDEGFRFFAVPVKVRGLGSFPVRAFALRSG